MKKAFTFWSGSEFSLMNFISILSFARHHNDVEVVIYTLDEPLEISKKWLTPEHNLSIDSQLICDLNTLSIEKNIRIEPLSRKVARKISSTVQFSDYVRILKLYEHGGIWFDADILFRACLPDYFFNFSNQVLLTTYENTIPTGLLGACPKSELMYELLNLANKVIDSNIFADEYQSLGPDLWRDFFIEKTLFNSGYVKNFPSKLIYPYPWNGMDKFYYGKQYIDDEVCGVHWFNGAEISKRFINNHLGDMMFGRNFEITPIERILKELEGLIDIEGIIKAKFYTK